MEEAKHFIAGEWTLPAQLETIAVVDPSDGQPFASIARGTAPDIERAVAAARDAFAGPLG
ncbi:aldehyde dehydrogenase family protein, partial [Burkholderia sp. Tr-849]|uniref:aldehyde dehydrogenase family protein n=1 Tax=Burkholderia sp. Tr-849 TaxID=2608330 RepID=UPI0014224437